MSDRFGLVVFDWDGTLMDSVANIVETMQATISRLDLPARSDHDIRGVIGLGLYEALTALFPDLTRKDQERIREIYREHFLGAPTRPKLFDGVLETLQGMVDSGKTLAVATGKGRAGLDRELEETGIVALISASRCADECSSKPAPQMLDELMELLTFAPVDTLMVGDAEFDLLMARNAGTASVGVSGGAHDDERLLRHGPLALIPSVVELPRVLRQTT